MNLVTVYDLRSDTMHVTHMQEASLRRPDLGLSPSPALIGSKEWWAIVADGRLSKTELEGKISKVYWASMGDYPEFELTTEDGARSTWTRDGDYTRYVEGLRARLAYVLHPWKHPNVHGLGTHSKQVLLIEVEKSDRRSDPTVPRPEGMGLAGPSSG